MKSDQKSKALYSKLIPKDKLYLFVTNLERTNKHIKNQEKKIAIDNLIKETSSYHYFKI